jgi:RNA polymerase sigma-70 factor (ECF subfamily)
VNGAYRRVVGADDRLPTGETLRSVQTTGVVQGERFPSVLIAAQRGVEWAISALYREFHPRILRYLRAHDEAHADEVGTLVWMDVAAGLPRFEGDEGTFRRWLFSLARQRVLERRAPIPARPDSGATAPTPAEERTDSPDGLVEAALARVAGLPPEQAEVVLLGILGDLDIGDIAAITEQQPGLVHLLESQALRGLRETSVSAGPEQEA